MVNTRLQAKAADAAAGQPDDSCALDNQQNAAALSSQAPPGEEQALTPQQQQQQQQQHPSGSLRHLLNQHIDPLPHWAQCLGNGRTATSAPPVQIPFNDVQAPTLPSWPSPWNSIGAKSESPISLSSQAPTAPPLSACSWGGILTLNTFMAEYGGQGSVS
ncbi:hypothetical protein BT96DRAFT_992377 [Gymnopus androsaceus JB14]|uniref:Uncharacterized protein n=1 Tax=Gymnopus androsaceus JB14 TaxID=1447944 RepID=A0A6A4HQ70_9AGAR|nr:hypothetical protein BT96DRAFT_992377 [Gymnopus androsaceus JB14]